MFDGSIETQSPLLDHDVDEFGDAAAGFELKRVIALRGAGMHPPKPM
jgi:hypothetical protein